MSYKKNPIQHSSTITKINMDVVKNNGVVLRNKKYKCRRAEATNCRARRNCQNIISTRFYL
jgi:hypothetical protein